MSENFIYVDEFNSIKEISAIELSEMELNYRLAKGVKLTLLSNEEGAKVLELEKAKNKRIISRKLYLQETDWQASAFIKYGRPIDASVKEKCLQAKTEIEEIKAATTLTQLQQFSEEFV